MENRFIRAEDVAQELNDCRACKSPVFLRKALRSRKGGNVNAGI